MKIQNPQGSVTQLPCHQSEGLSVCVVKCALHQQALQQESHIEWQKKWNLTWHLKQEDVLRPPRPGGGYDYHLLCVIHPKPYHHQSLD